MSDTQRLSQDEVRDIAELAKLDLSDDEITMYTDQLSQILDYFTLLQEVDTSGVDATSSVLPFTTVLRADDPQPALEPETALLNAPDAEAQQFKVSAVLSNSD